MPDLETCPELEKVIDCIDSNDPVPQNLIEHARTCELSRFWLCRLLAICKAVLTVDRVAFPTCVGPKRFQLFLFAHAAAEKNFDFVTTCGDAARKVVFCGSEGELSVSVFQTQWHIDECEHCRNYLNDISIAITKFHKEYEEMIENGVEIRPHSEKSAKVIHAILANCDETKKPN